MKGFIIGGSPSTGSSLLRQILNRHTQIVCAHETHIWAKKNIVRDWGRLKSKLNGSKILNLRDAGLFPFKGINRDEIPNFTDKQFNQLIKKDQDIYSFFQEFMRIFYQLNSHQIFGEKTPGNVENFKDILELDEKIVCIHTTRNPYDTIASLVARGKPIPEAVGFYLMNCSKALNAGIKDRLLTIRYEQLVQEPRKEIQSILNVLKLKFEENMLLPNRPKAGEITKIDGWKYDEAGVIGKESVGRFEELTAAVKGDIISFVWHMKLKDASSFKSIPEISHSLGYESVKPNDDFTTERIEAFNSFNKKLVFKNANFILKSPFIYK